VGNELPPPGEGPQHVASGPPELPPPDECLRDRPAGATPKIVDRFEMLVDPPSFAFMWGERSARAEVRGDMRFADGRPLDLRALAVAADAFPPPAFHVMDMGWVPTLELTVHFRAKPKGRWLRCRFGTRFVFGGHLEEDGEMWDEDGQLVALSRQMAIVPRVG